MARLMVCLVQERLCCGRYVHIDFAGGKEKKGLGRCSCLIHQRRFSLPVPVGRSESIAREESFEKEGQDERDYGTEK